MSAAARAQGSAALFGVLFLLTEWFAAHLNGGYSLFQVVWMRYLVHLLLVLLIWGRGRIGVFFVTSKPVVHVVRSLLMLTMPASWILFGRRGGDALLPMIDFALVPLITLLAAKLVSRTSVRPHAWVASAVMAGAALLLNLYDYREGLWMALFATLPAISLALYIVATWLIRMDPLGVNLFQTALTVFLVISVVQPRIWLTPTWHDVPVIGAIAVSGLLCLLALDRMVHFAPVDIAVPFIVVLPLWEILVAVAASRTAGSMAALGAALIVGALLLCVIASYRRRQRPVLPA